VKITSRLKWNIRRYLNHYLTLKVFKFFITSNFIANNSLYKRWTMEKAQTEARQKNEFRDSICIETALTCNSRCIFCGHHNETMNGIMTKELFEKIIDDCCEFGIKNATLGVYGEIFTDKDILMKVKYLRKRNMTYGILTNGSLLTSHMTDELFNLGGLTFINFSVNGYSKEVYENTMIGLKRDRTYQNILYFLKKKEELRSDKLIVTISAVETEKNKDDFRNFYRFWSQMPGVYSVQSAELIDRMGKDYDGEIGQLGPMTKQLNWLAPCRMLWGSLNVYYDGRVGPCCKDNDKRELIVGDLTKQSVREVSTGNLLNGLRQLHLAGRRKDHPVCGECYLNSFWIR
jgi:MoaA/NifB/PqqE/SkfB family radical SAM enzyme